MKHFSENARLEPETNTVKQIQQLYSNKHYPGELDEKWNKTEQTQQNISMGKEEKRADEKHINK